MCVWVCECECECVCVCVCVCVCERNRKEKRDLLRSISTRNIFPSWSQAANRPNPSQHTRTKRIFSPASPLRDCTRRPSSLCRYANNEQYVCRPLDFIRTPSSPIRPYDMILVKYCSVSFAPDVYDIHSAGLGGRRAL